MSGNVLKEAAIQGDHERLCQVLKDRANSCSADEYGLTPLMYACWNGHEQSVIYLAANPMGVDSTGKKTSCIDLVSCKGYSALHLTALDCPTAKASSIITALLLLGANSSIKCRNGLTAYDIAMKLGKTAVLRSFHDFDTQDENIGMKMEMNDRRKEFQSKYAFHYQPKMDVTPWKSNFDIPDFIYEPLHVGAIAPGMIIHEQQILPLMDEAVYEKEGTDALHCLRFAHEQAKTSRNRRAKLISAGDPGFELPSVHPVAVVAKRKCAKRSKEDNYQG